jgi:hypothetical protein
MDVCFKKDPVMVEITKGHFVRCHFYMFFEKFKNKKLRRKKCLLLNGVNLLKKQLKNWQRLKKRKIF